MATMYSFVVFAAIVASISAANSTFEDCHTDFNTLEQALYETGDNLFELNRIFYPPYQRTSRFIRVNYTFLNETGGDDGCSVAYIWAIGVLLFFQPPRLFTLNSLYFNYPNNNLTTLNLKLPYECRHLLDNSTNSTDDTCSCLNDSRKLDILTQQVSIKINSLIPRLSGSDFATEPGDGVNSADIPLSKVAVQILYM